MKADKTLAGQRSWQPWRWLLAACVVAVGTVDGFITAESTGFFGTGFNGVAVGSSTLVALFVAASVVIDATLVLGIWLVLVRPMAWLGVGNLTVFVMAAAASVGIPLVIAATRLNVESVLGRLPLVPLDLVSGGSASVVAQVSEVFDPMVAGIFGLSLAAITVVCRSAQLVTRRIPDTERIFEPPSARTLVACACLCAAVSVALLVVPSDALDRVRYGLRAKPGRMLLTEAIRRGTDVDLDGFGWSDRPRDTAPFDGRVHPYAIDVPGNGLDENGLGGDHPVGFSEPRSWQAPAREWTRRPHVLVVLLESFRADLLGARLAGREVTPFLNRLAAEGASSRRTYSHCPSTVPSRAQLLSGEILYERARSSMVDDFLAHGYHVAWFSGQDASYGDTEQVLGIDRVHTFYDARQDLERRTSRSTAAVSLQVSWKTVIERVQAFLDTKPEGPLFLYVNFADTHFPYVHDELDRILDVEPLSIDQIRVHRARQVRDAYANTAANVDRAVAHLFESVRAFAGDEPLSVLITADHGQAFYEDGYLGHGRSIRGDQARVPLVLWGLWGRWPEPVGLSDLRGLLLQSLSLDDEAREPARFEPDPEHELVHWAPNLERPTVIGLRNAEGLAELDLTNDEFRTLRSDGGDRAVSDPDDPVRLRVVRSWEVLQQLACGASQGDCLQVVRPARTSRSRKGSPSATQAISEAPATANALR